MGRRPAVPALIQAALSLAWPAAALALTGSHQVIVAYYPIFPRWYTPQGCVWIGDTVRQYPLLGLYNNKTDVTVNVFDFEALARAGVTVVNPHMFSSGLDGETLERLDRIDAAARESGVMWTPTFEALTGDGPALAATTNDIVATYGPDTRLMRVDGGRPVFFWHMRAVPAQEVVDAVEVVRAAHGPVIIILDEACTMGQPCQNGNGLQPVNPLFAEPDASTGEKRITGFYQWVSVFWALQPGRLATAENYVSSSLAGGFLPVLCSTPSYNEENWGYGTEGDNCGIGGDRSRQPHYNVDRSLNEWQANLHDVLEHATAESWLYIQAYDEWAEGSAISPDTYSCYGFLAELHEALQDKHWLCGASSYCRPEHPAGYSPTQCTDTPVCGQGAVVASHEAETDLSHLCGYPITGGWRVDVTSNHCYMAYGPYTSSLPAGELTARFWLRVDDNTADDADICHIDVRDATAGSQLTVSTIQRPTWCQQGVYEPLDLTFTTPLGGHLLEFRTYYVGNAQLDLDRVEILSMDLPAKASQPDPPHQAADLSLSTQLSWVPGPGAISHDVHLGTTTTPPYQGNQTSTVFEPARLAPEQTYYWRIVEHNDAGATPGDLWSFSTEVFGDHDGDGDVDQEDFGHFQTCLSGSGRPRLPACEDVDGDNDHDVDQDDFEFFLACMSSPDALSGTEGLE